MGSFSGFIDRNTQRSIAVQLEGALLISTDLFPYFVLVALEAGGLLRAVALLLFYPIIWLLNLTRHRTAALHAMIFISTFGLKIHSIKAVAKATLQKFFLEDIRESSFKVFSGYGGKKYVLTRLPRVMVEPFLREYLDVNCVIGTELKVIGRTCSGLVVPTGADRAEMEWFQALKVACGDDQLIDVGLAARSEDRSFLLLCKEHYVISPQEDASPLARKDYPKPFIFHDGRLVTRPDPIRFLAVFLWFPIGVFLAVTRVLVGIVFPYKVALPILALNGFRIRIGVPVTQKETDPKSVVESPKTKGTLYVCNHQTLLDPVLLSTAILRRVSAVTYSLSSFSEVISPIPTVRLTRDRFKDREIMRSMLERGDLVVCPEGTTCREQYLLRFSPLFAEIADKIVPVAVRARGGMFYGTTARGYKWLDSPFFLMNPFPWYEFNLHEPVSGRPDSKELCYDIANGIQMLIGKTLGFECTNLTRRDKYRMLAGNDGIDQRN
ncbi:Glycerol-3-Phosphate Acyltransferase [Rhynchospora pubera]|uniref:Glycerol-3-Phosphate Acyltransferase n=1 Tax=Rhynchospora pubera TaxID=906938 RepID=A0AAV8EWZ5_9POAL|nr:Glycerol-3-Phosphate Acyltransferase [Rhynchospora pubera]KAJ4785683.1 Glycerol-3-Phosphate Acyltransferase [Rhynchospora pubera]